MKFLTVLNILFTFRVLSNERLPWKTEGALKNRGCPEYAVLNMYFLLFRVFEQLALALKNTVYPEIFHCIEYVFFIIQDFWATCACPEKQSCPGIFHCIEYVFFIIQDFWATSACPENRVCPGNFQARWGGRPSRPPPRTLMLTFIVNSDMFCCEWRPLWIEMKLTFFACSEGGM